MDKREIKDRLRVFVLRDLMPNPAYSLRDDEPLLTSGLIDSFSVAQIGVFVEVNFGVYIPDTDLTVENIDTLDRMADYIVFLRRQAVAESP
ncbi:MAG: acyl carrier protein [Acidobacteriota bacterium]